MFIFCVIVQILCIFAILFLGQYLSYFLFWGLVIVALAVLSGMWLLRHILLSVKFAEKEPVQEIRYDLGDFLAQATPEQSAVELNVLWNQMGLNRTYRVLSRRLEELAGKEMRGTKDAPGVTDFLELVKALNEEKN